jgi:TRAP-type C4-dicarboxylate transport system permease small subunit
MSAGGRDSEERNMPAENRFERFVKQWAKWSSFVAYVGCALMLILSVIDIVGAKLFRWPLPGGVDAIGLLAVLVAALPLASTELTGGHVRLDLGLAFLPKRIKTICQRVGNVFSLILFIFLIVSSFKYGVAMQTTGEASMTVAIPFAPFVFAIVLACLPVLLVLLLEIKRPESVEKEVDKI